MDAKEDGVLEVMGEVGGVEEVELANGRDRGGDNLLAWGEP